MKKLLIALLLACSCVSLIFAESPVGSTMLRVNGIHVDEVFDGGDGGIGITTEIALVVLEGEDYFATVGYEIGYIESDSEEIEGFDEVTADLIPIFINYTIAGSLEDSRTIWEIGAGLGVTIVEVDLDQTGSSDLNDDDLVFGGQIFGSLGYELTDSVQLSFGLRYIIAEDFDFQDSTEGLEIEDFQLDDTLDSLAFDISLSVHF